MKIQIPLDESVWQQMDASDKIDAICDAFETAWQRGEKPQIADYAALLTSDARADLLRELIIVDRQLTNRQQATEQKRFARPHATQSLRHGQIDTDIEFLENEIGDPTDASRELELPTNFGDYILLAPIGRGSFGKVYLAESTRSGGQVAIKIPHAALISDPDDYKLFIREARNASSLSHPGIVKVHDIEFVDQTPILVSDYIAGKNLRDFLVEVKSLPLRTAVQFVIGLSAAVEYAHQNGVIHRDIKPSNILVEQKGPLDERGTKNTVLRPLLLDFGIAKRIGFNTLVTQAGAILGTPGYMSPEQASGNSGNVTARSDIFSLGVILYELLTAKLPFEGTSQEILSKVQHYEAPSPQLHQPKIPRNLSVICQKAIRLEAADRYASAADFADDLQRWMNDEPILARPLPLTEWAVRKARKHWQEILASVAICAACVVAFSFAWKWYVKEREMVANLLIADPSSHLGPAKPSTLEDWLLQAPQSLQNTAPLLESMQSASPDRILKIGMALRPHGSYATTMLQTAFKQINEDPIIQSRIACVYGVVDPIGFESLVDVPFIVDTIVAHNCFGDVAGYTKLTQPFRLPLIQPLIDRYARTPVSPQRTSCQKWLAGLITGGSIANAMAAIVHSEPDELLAWRRLMEPHAEKAEESLRKKRESIGSNFGGDPSDEQQVKAYANLALMAYGLGLDQEFWPMLERNPDPRIRTYVIHQLCRTNFPKQPLIDRLFVQSDASIVYAILVAIGQYSENDLGQNQVESVTEWLKSNYVAHPDSGVHSMCRWLLGRWGEQAFLDASDQALSQQGLVEERQWYVNQLGMTMLVVREPGEVAVADLVPSETRTFQNPAGTRPMTKVRLLHSYAIGIDEITREDFQKYLNSHPVEGKPILQEDPKNLSLPAVGLSWVDAMQFCQWLSTMDGISDGEASITSEGSTKDMTALDHRKVGYRLPTSVEWEHACRAGSMSDFHHGTIDTPWREMYCFDEADFNLSSPVGRRLPNDWGLFDGISNASEWLSTHYDSKGNRPLVDAEIFEIYMRQAVEMRGQRIVNRTPHYWRPYFGVPEKASKTGGFRVAHTIR